MVHNPHVMVIGGGPAGSTTAALLARAGVRVTLLERDTFPRYHIGESLLASVLPILHLSGAYDKVAAHGFQVKRGAYFQWQNDDWLLNWADLADAEGWSWQVDRAPFDELLLRNASDQGVEVFERATANQVVFDAAQRPSAVQWTSADDNEPHTTTCDFLVDASGRAGVLAKHFGMRRAHQGFRNIAIWSYWRGARLHPASPEGASNTVSTPEGGWFWNIPLGKDIHSVGYVVSTKVAAQQVRKHGSRDAYYHAIMRDTPKMMALVEGAEQIASIRAEQDYSYVSDRLCGPGYALVGDSGLFLDPLLSSGIHLATYGGLTAAASIATLLRGEMSEADALAFHEYTYRRAYERFLVLVSRMYKNYIGSDEYFSHAAALTEEHDGETAAESFTRITAGLTDVQEGSGAQQRTATSTIVSEANDYREDGGKTTHLGTDLNSVGDYLDTSHVWNIWRDPLGADTTMGEVRITTEPVLGLTTRARTAEEQESVGQSVLRPPIAANPAH